MTVLAFIVALLAGVLFIVAWIQSQWTNLVAAGLAALTAAWILQLVVTGTLIH